MSTNNAIVPIPADLVASILKTIYEEGYLDGVMDGRWRNPPSPRCYFEERFAKSITKEVIDNFDEMADKHTFLSLVKEALVELESRGELKC